MVLTTVLVAALAGVLTASAWSWSAPWLLGGFAAVAAARSAWSMVRDLLRGNVGVDVLAVTAIVAAVAVGEVWAAVIVVLMLTGGEALEDYAAHRAEHDLTALLSNAPRVGHRLLPDGTTEDVPVDEIRPLDRVLVRAGEVVPVDGTLLTAVAELDESSLTGESLPAERVAGDEVLSGGVNGASAVTLEVTRAARDSQYQQIIALVEGAAASRSPMVRLADRFAVPFTAVAFLVAGAAWWVSGDAVRFAEVLVVATPCPLIIAAPVAFMAGMSRSAHAGAIIKSSETLEKLHGARAVAFDKTGTLTSGRPELTEVRSAGRLSSDEVLRLAASAEQFSSHVLAQAVLGGATARGLTVAGSGSAEESTANGVTAQVEGRTVVVGKRAFVAAAAGQDVPPTALEPGELAVYVAAGGTYAGALVLRDEVRADARTTVDDLRSHGIRHIVMLTGDARPTAEHVAAELGIDDVRADCLPAQKVEAVVGLVERPVVMVGDGVNDAPVLAAADVGIAMGARGSTAASESADVVILRDDVSLVATTLTIGRETVNVALQSIWVGIGLSVALMLVAASGVLPAVVGAWCQEGVDVLSILWALRATGSRSQRVRVAPSLEQAPVPS
ncbi:heavy metal-(Cd/Co/Hg/Pb/Zn)-translocating P-type ATPase [Sanguibacter antarcticus]|uniref:Heavy metal-(Cd/Co/Hg/Pb/Zn)-translocating P-type ATPase n=2 Tax=Sanguibacter antarcticus TaxID=372484 RepID=A0A2A9E224_9MICO|nr:heavy metal-(Cd/Co/Hg/Pb/Zn)-translocating P-type ATPase [Sanguibacter antarcticus]